MPDQRSVLKEYRYLDAKRAAEGLTPDEEARLARLRDLIGPETGAGGLARAASSGGGFDVNAAAAHLRESLLPAGRARPAPEIAPDSAELSAADALAASYGAAPEAEGRPFDAAAGYDASAQAYDPNAQAYDPNGYDPGAALDPNAPAYDPGVQPYDPSAAAYDPNAQAYDPNAYDPGAALDPNAPAYASAYDPGAQPYDPAAAGYDPNAQPYDPAAYGASAPGYDAAYDPVDPNAPLYGADGQPLDLAVPPEEGAPAWTDPAAEAEVAAGDDAASEIELVPAEPLDDLDPAAEPAVAAIPPPEGDLASLAPPGWDAEPAPPEAPPAGILLGEYDEMGAGAPTVAPDPAPDELAAALPFDAAAVSALPPGDVPEGYAAPLGEYDDTAGLVAPAYAASDVEPGAPGLDLAPATEDLEGGPSAADAALGEGFRLESDGSFGADAAEPDWATAAAAPPWEAVPALGVAAADPDARDATGFEIAPTPEGETFGDAAPALDFSQPDLSADEAATMEPPGPGQDGEPPALGTEPDGAAEEAAPAPLGLDVGFGDGAAGDEATPPGDQGVAIDSAVAAALEAAPPASAAGGVAVDFDFETEVVEVVEGADIFEEIDDGSAGPPPRSLDFEPLVPAPAPPLAAPEIAPPPEPTPIAPPSPQAAPAPPAAAIAPSPPAAPAALAPAALAPAALAPAAPAPAAPAPAAAAAPAATPSCVLAGSHRVVVHTVEGTVKRGTLADPDLAAAFLPLAPPAGGAQEEVPTEKVKAIFFMLAPGEKPPVAQGKKVRVTFRDGRQVAGFSPDYSETAAGFFMIPGDTRTNTGRIWVYRAAVRQVAVS